jgi:hypothetical protein
MNPSLRRWFCLACTMLLALAGLLGCHGAMHGRRARAVVKQVDHVGLLSDNPDQLFRFFTDTLGLPVAWDFAAYGSFSSGGVHMKNVNVETLSMKEIPAPHASLFGIVWEPYPLAEIRGELKRRGTKPGEPQPFMGGSKDSPVLLWTQQFLDALCTDAYVVYLCEYSPSYLQHLRDRTANLPARLGGIGLTSVREVVLSTRDHSARMEAWDAFLAPAIRLDGRYRIGNGPALRFVPGGEDRILSLLLEVESLDAARSFLQGKGVLGSVGADRITISPAAVQNLDIQLVQK